MLRPKSTPSLTRNSRDLPPIVRIATHPDDKANEPHGQPLGCRSSTTSAIGASSGRRGVWNTTAAANTSCLYASNASTYSDCSSTPRAEPCAYRCPSPPLVGPPAGRHPRPVSGPTSLSRLPAARQPGRRAQERHSRTATTRTLPWTVSRQGRPPPGQRREPAGPTQRRPPGSARSPRAPDLAGHGRQLARLHGQQPFVFGPRPCVRPRSPPTWPVGRCGPATRPATVSRPVSREDVTAAAAPAGSAGLGRAPPVARDSGGASDTQAAPGPSDQARETARVGLRHLGADHRLVGPSRGRDVGSAERREVELDRRFELRAQLHLDQARDREAASSGRTCGRPPARPSTSRQPRTVSGRRRTPSTRRRSRVGATRPAPREDSHPDARASSPDPAEARGRQRRPRTTRPAPSCRPASPRSALMAP